MASGIYIALGSNVGDRNANLHAAIDRIGTHPQIDVTGTSVMLETAPVDSPAGAGDFLNAVIDVRTDLSPRELLSALHEIERQMGRERSVRNAPRTIDLDLLLYDDLIIDEPDLIVPHPRMHERVFVLQPLYWLAGPIVHPVLGRTIANLIADLDARGA